MLCPQAGHGWSCPQDKMESKIVCLLLANVILTILYVISNCNVKNVNILNPRSPTQIKVHTVYSCTIA